MHVLFAIVMVNCNTSETYFQTCSTYINRKSSLMFIESYSTTSAYTCAFACYITYQCEAYTFNSVDRTCSLYRNRAVGFINETTAIR